MLFGSIVALITPMNEDGSLDFESLKRIIDFHIDNQTNAIVVASTTGECFSLSENEKYQIVMKSLEFSKNRIPILVGIGSSSMLNTINIVNKLKSKKISAFLNVAPPFSLPTQEGLFSYFENISMHSKIPFILYNNPSRTGCDILPYTVYKLSKIKNIIGIKDSTGDLTRISKTYFFRPSKNFLFFSGDDSSYLDFIKLGGKGLISVAANIAANKISRICSLAINGKSLEAFKINENLVKLYKCLLSEPNPTVIKWICKKVGLINHDTTRLPILPIKEQNIKFVEQAMLETKL